MKTIAVPHTGKSVSVLGFGCATLMGRASHAESLRALGGAWDAGIRFFDVARSYGYGAAESVVGEFLQGRREDAFVCTKFGILPAAKNWKHTVLPLARKVVKLFPGARKLAQRGARSEFSTNNFTVEVLRTSLETSLRELRTEYVDMLLLHAAPPEVLRSDELLRALERVVEQGKVRMAGVSGPRETMEAYFAAPPPVLKTAQFACNIFEMGITSQTPGAAAKGLFLVANHPFGGPAGVAETTARLARLRASDAMDASLREKLDINDPALMPEVVLNSVLQGTGISAMVPAMMRAEHMQANIRAVESCRFTAEELAQIRVGLS